MRGGDEKELYVARVEFLMRKKWNIHLKHEIKHSGHANTISILDVNSKLEIKQYAHTPTQS